MEKERGIIITNIDNKKQCDIHVVVNCKHDNYTPYYGREGELMFKQCDTCGEEFD